MPSYRVLTPIRHDTQDYHEGDTIQLLEHEAKQLLELHAVEPIVKPFATPSVARPAAKEPQR